MLRIGQAAQHAGLTPSTRLLFRQTSGAQCATALQRTRAAAHSSPTMIIEVLTLADCPNALPTLSLLKTIVAQHRSPLQIRHIVVSDEKTTQDLRFAGSPTIRVDGRDVDPANAVTDYGLLCRVYRDGERLSGVPSASMIRRALEACGG